MQVLTDYNKIKGRDSKALLRDAVYLNIHGMTKIIFSLTFRGSRIGLFMAACVLSDVVFSEELLIAVASNFSGPMSELSNRFESQTGHEIQVAYGSSGRLFAQIRSGAPFQIFLSADQDKPARLVELGLADPTSRFTYASGELVLWSVDRERKVVDSSALLNSGVNKIAVANPRLAPYGAAAVGVLDKLNLSKTLSGKIVRGENIAQAFQFVKSGNAQLGFVARSQVMSLNETRGGATWVVPEHLYQPIRQDAVLLNRAIDCHACSEFLNFLREDAQRTFISASGYRVE
tara:strand:- start:4186 stop:5052 length:867 start_codon:yes stop_codon:yes gene_type:complete